MLCRFAGKIHSSLWRYPRSVSFMSDQAQWNYPVCFRVLFLLFLLLTLHAFASNGLDNIFFHNSEQWASDGNLFCWSFFLPPSLRSFVPISDGWTDRCSRPFFSVATKVQRQNFDNVISRRDTNGNSTSAGLDQHSSRITNKWDQLLAWTIHTFVPSLIKSNIILFV